MTAQQIWKLNAESRQSHYWHRTARNFQETNCYVDLLIELIHQLGADPIFAMGSTVSVDFEGDQWTFFKPSFHDLELLFGLRVHELNVYLPLEQHAQTAIASGRIPLIELDAYYLPDTAATSYRSQHVKTTCAVQHLDLEARHVGYFHNAGYFEASGDDFDGLFRRGEADPKRLPPYVEFIRVADFVPRSESELRQIATTQLARHIAHRPASNPVIRFGEQLQSALPAGRDNASMDLFHLYSFATLRQLGSACELGAAHLRLVAGENDNLLLEAALAHDELSADCKALSFKIARSAASGKKLEPGELLGKMASNWQRATNSLLGFLEQSTR